MHSRLETACRFFPKEGGGEGSRKREVAAAGFRGADVAFWVIPAMAQQPGEVLVSPLSNPDQYCYTETGHWGWDGPQYVWVPTRTICEPQE